MFGDSGVCVEVAEVYGTMSCLIVMSDRAATEGSKYFELGQQPSLLADVWVCTELR